MEHSIKPGDQLYHVYNDSRDQRPGFITVKSVGKKWITSDQRRPHRFDIETLRSENGRSRLYLSKEIHDAEVERREAWGTLRNLIQSVYVPPEQVPTEDILKAIGLLTPPRKDPADA